MAKLKININKKGTGKRVVINFNEEDYVVFKLKNGLVKPVHKYLADKLVKAGKGSIVKDAKLTKDDKGTAKVIDVD
jgi:hypothetical protein